MLRAFIGALLIPGLLVVPGFVTATLDASVDPISAEIIDQDAVFAGYLFWHQSDELRNDVENRSLLTDAAGKLVHSWSTNLTGGGTPAYLMPNGGVARVGIRDRVFARSGPVASTDTLQFTDVHGRMIWELRAQDFEDILFHHDFELMNNGNVLVTTYERLSAEEARALGWDPGEMEEVWTDGVLEVRPDLEFGGHDVVWHWRFADHIVQDRFPERPNFGVISETPERVDPHYPKNYLPRNIVRQHINSLDYNEELDQVLLSSLIYNEIWIIDHSTTTAEAAGSTGGRSGKGGDLLFRYGNPEAYGRGSPSDRLFLKQHDANWIDTGLPGAGHVLVHNNNTSFAAPAAGPGAAPVPASGNVVPRAGREILDAQQGSSNVYELKLTPSIAGVYTVSPEKAFEAELVWLWEQDDYFADFQGGARRLPNGNTLVSDTTDYLVVEVNPAGDVVARYKGSAPVFKAFKYSVDQVAPVLEVLEALDEE